MESEEQNKLKFEGVSFPKVEFQVLKPLEKDLPINIEINPKIFCPKDKPESFKIIMIVKIWVKEFFNLDLMAIGDFNIVGKEITPEIRAQFKNVNSIAIMFPYIRSFVTSFSANVGQIFDTLYIPPRFFQGELEEFEIPDEKTEGDVNDNVSHHEIDLPVITDK